jgi:hypothetical protein
MPPEVMDAFQATDDNYFGADWHVVFKGRTPGMYPAWYAPWFEDRKAGTQYLDRNFAATQVIKVPGAVHYSYSTKEEVIKAFKDAEADGLVAYL